MQEFDTVGVVGLGTMGAGICEVLARGGLQVVAVETDEESLRRGRERLEGSTGRAVDRGKLSSGDRDALLARITTVTDLAALADTDLVIEAVPEHMAVKRDLFTRLDAICRPQTVFATNTSALSVTELAVVTGRPTQVVGLHWFNPAPVMGLVEVVCTVVTDPDVEASARALVERLGKTAAVVSDRAGFIANALLFGYLNNAVRMWEAGYASREDIDAAMRLGTGHPMGPLALLDLIGLDSAYEILEAIYRASRDHLHAPAPILKQLVTAGFLGRKTGRGIYTYAGPGSPDTADVGRASGPSLEGARPVTRIGVVGTGTMATGIVEVCATRGYDVVFRARGEDRVAAVLAKVTKSLDLLVRRGRMEQERRDETLARITGTTDLAGLADCDLVIEAVVEDLAVKQALFAELDAVVRPGAVLATTTSSLPVIDCATATGRPADVVGMHWFNPVTAMQLVELVPTVVTADDALATVREVTVRCGKHPVVCGDRAGFIVNALLFPYLNDAARMLEAHYATVHDIDVAMTKGCGHPMGPFALMDVVGLDVTLAIQRRLYEEFREPGYNPAPLLQQMVTAGYLGRKTGRGFRAHAAR